MGIAILLVASAAPARAGSLSYSDLRDDATRVADLDPPRSSDPELDLLEVNWRTTADELVVTTTLAAAGPPPAANGWALGQYFTYNDIAFELLAQDVGSPSDQAFGDGVYLRVEGDSSTEYPCVCRFIVRPERRQVEVRAELHSIGSAARTMQPRAPRPSVGSKFSALATVSYRVAGFLLAADDAAAPAEATLTV